MRDLEPIDFETMQKLVGVMVEERVKDLEEAQKHMEDLVKKLHRAGYNAHRIQAVLKIYGYRFYYLGAPL